MVSLVLLCIWWVVPAMASFIFMIFTMATCWFWALFVLRKSRDLPWFLSWLGQWDDNLRANREGKSWTDKKYVQWIRSRFPGKFGWWLEASIWIFRNPSQYFDYWKNGQTIKPGWDEASQLPFEIIVKGDGNVKNNPVSPGWYVKLLKTGDRLIPCFRLIKKLPFMKVYFHLWLGWQYPDKTEEIRPHSKAQVKFTIGFVW